MSMQKFNCPHCGHLIGPVAVNDKVKTAANHMICSNCKKHFSWQGIYGQIKTMK
mgnify:FL=1|jgi:transcription elongation factor Elf1